MRVDSDLEDVRKAKSGDASAFEDLIRRHGRDVHAVCRRFTRDEHEAEDLAQEALFRAYRGLAGFREDSSFRTWLFRIVLNVGRTWWSTRRVSEAPPTRVELPSTEAETLEAMRAEIARLPDLQREVLTLRVFGGLEFDEIAELLDTTPGAARVHLSLARKTLAERLEVEP